MNNVGASEYYDSEITSGELTFAYIIPEEINELQCLTVKLTSTDYKYLQPPLTINVQVHNIEEDGHTPDDGGMTLPGEETQEPPVTTEDPQQPVDDEITLTEGETQGPPVSAEDPQQPVDDEITLTEGETQEPPVATEDPQQPVDEGMTLPEEDTQEPPVTADPIEPPRTPLTPCGLHYQTQTALAIRGSMVIPNKLDPTKLTLVVLPLTPNCDISFFGRAFNNDGRRTILVEESHTDWSRQNAQQITRPLAGRRIPKCIQFQYGAQLRAPGTGGRITEILLQ
jgi:hypothetical protein